MILLQVVKNQVRKIQHCQTQISNLMPSKIFPFPPQSSSACSFKSSVFLSGMTSNDSTATFLPFSGVKFYLESDIHFDIWDFLLKFETQRQGIAASYWSTSIYLRFNNKISSRNMDSQCPNGKFLPAFLIFLSKNLMAEAGTFSTNNFLFSKISAVLGNRGMINWTHTPDLSENLNGYSHQEDFPVVPCSKMPCWGGEWGQRPRPVLPQWASHERRGLHMLAHPELAGSWWKPFQRTTLPFALQFSLLVLPPSPPISSSSSTPMSSTLSQSLLFSSFHYSPVFFGRRLVCDKRT